jgi:hypothetical protein
VGEMARALGISRQAVHKQVRRLTEAGLVARGTRGPTSWIAPTLIHASTFGQAALDGHRGAKPNPRTSAIPGSPQARPSGRPRAPAAAAPG